MQPWAIAFKTSLECHIIQGQKMIAASYKHVVIVTRCLSESFNPHEVHSKPKHLEIQVKWGIVFILVSAARI